MNNNYQLTFIPSEGVSIEQLDELRFEIMNVDPASEYIPAITAAIVRMQFPAPAPVVYADVIDPVFVRVLRLVGAGG